MRIIILLAATFLLLATSAFAETVRVVTKDNVIRDECRFFSQVKARVRYDDPLQVLGKEADWYRVKFHNVKGCIHKSAVVEQEVSLAGVSGSSMQSASKEEVALAGKGFNPQVEQSFKSKHPNLDFEAVNRIEGFKVPEENLRKFIRTGGLKEP